MSRFDFFFRAERSKAILEKAGQTFDEYWAGRPAFTMTVDCVDDSTLDQAIVAALQCGLPRGSARGGCFEVQGPKGIWSHVKGRRLLGADPSKIEFVSWEEAEQRERTEHPSDYPAESAPVAQAAPEGMKDPGMILTTTCDRCKEDEITIVFGTDRPDIEAPGRCAECASA